MVFIPSNRIETFHRILIQERSAGFQDNIVIGGLDKFLERFSDDLKPILRDRCNYRRMSHNQRLVWADEMISKIRYINAAGDEPIPISNTKRVERKRMVSKVNHQKSVTLTDDVSQLEGVARQTAYKLKRLGIEKIEDLLFHFPSRHNDFGNTRKISELVPGEEQTIVATLWEASETKIGGTRRSTQAVLGDDTGNVRVVWFNNHWLSKTLKPGMRLAINGKVNVFRGRFVFESPEHEILPNSDDLVVDLGGMVPVYPTTEGLSQRAIRRLVKRAFDCGLKLLGEYIPRNILDRNDLMGIRDAVYKLHYPDSEADRRMAHKRLAFDELFLLQLTVLTQKRLWKEGRCSAVISSGVEQLRPFLESLPFELTGAQYRVLCELLSDIQSARPMRRLLQGDVGSGKTVVAVGAMLATVRDGYRAALMAPTEILAEQHFITICNLISDDQIEIDGEAVVRLQVPGLENFVVVGILLGSHSTRIKNKLYEMLSNGGIDIIIGTHALIQSRVDIPELGLVITDEQHRFGVMQRAALSSKGARPHVLAMSATPIPRSLALTVFGDLDVSAIDEIPSGRDRTRTRWVDSDRRDAAYGFVRKEVEAGRQGFIVCPLIEESEIITSRAAVAEYKRLSNDVFPDLKLGLLHGKIPLREKEIIMGKFKNRETDILVSTSVIEVGIDVPNATVMLVDGADRFGLSQLHQFRGRVGRGEYQSYCLLISDSPGLEARKRLKLLERVSDGFELAEEDLKMRGPGDYAGTRQSGLPTFKVASITDQDILALARRETIQLLNTDPYLNDDPNMLLSERLKEYTEDLTADIS